MPFGPSHLVAVSNALDVANKAGSFGIGLACGVFWPDDKRVPAPLLARLARCKTHAEAIKELLAWSSPGIAKKMKPPSRNSSRVRRNSKRSPSA